MSLEISFYSALSINNSFLSTFAQYPKYTAQHLTVIKNNNMQQCFLFSDHCFLKYQKLKLRASQNHIVEAYYNMLMIIQLIHFVLL